MIESDGFYSIPLLPREIAARLKDKADWPADLRNEYKRLHAEYTVSKAEFAMWIRRDRDSRMNRTAKAILLLVLDCLNFDTGRCDPGHQFIADELGVSVRTVERTIPRIAASGWLSITRRGKTTTNYYRLMVSREKIIALLNFTDGLREQRAEERERRRYFRPEDSDPTEMADHSDSDPTTVRGHDPTEMADHDPTEMAGKPMNRTFEDEPLNKGSCSDSSEVTYTRESIPVHEAHFGEWVRKNIPDQTRHREAFRLLRERKMTPEILRRLAA
ncbi:helix-turn-helix domain-containing protein [Rhizobium leguminosarum]|jgi:hypothetical protein|uniref:helix-turn-helix domain-containing protein n=1 Tax=Rhizobium leguminosarum TaxID=384 RepID=UPI0010308788|nr:helix-turn-helix domain-containing protein [Rhizobium leguminosarum]NEI66845.1 hypothetical protein [Rhizobium leguminosarum]TAY35894.1 helix-turn-helix domain-containing protein [Rhizobium leguminosarum]